jgi:ABC-type glycerol-3-phosphate transport system substrate-binding protein
MLINRDMFDAAGLPELSVEDVITFDQWLEFARA